MGFSSVLIAAVLLMTVEIHTQRNSLAFKFKNKISNLLRERSRYDDEHECIFLNICSIICSIKLPFCLMPMEDQTVNIHMPLRIVEVIN